MATRIWSFDINLKDGYFIICTITNDWAFVFGDKSHHHAVQMNEWAMYTQKEKKKEKRKRFNQNFRKQAKASRRTLLHMSPFGSMANTQAHGTAIGTHTSDYHYLK